MVGVGTARRVRVPVAFEARTVEPDQNPDVWDHIAEASLRVDSGSILISYDGRSSSVLGSTCLQVTTEFRVYWTGLDTISANGLRGSDRYYAVAWPSPPAPPSVIKRYPPHAWG